MTPKNAARLKELAREMEEILSSETDFSQLKTLTDVELEAQRRITEYVAPELMSFLLPRAASEEEKEARPTYRHYRKIQTTQGRIRLTNGQAKVLGIQKHAQFSDLIVRFAVVVAAKVSYAQAEKDLAFLCHIVISDSTLQRLVQRVLVPLTAPANQENLRKPQQKPRAQKGTEYLSPEGLPAPRKRGRKPKRYSRPESLVTATYRDNAGPGSRKVRHLSADGGKVRLACPGSDGGTEWRDYKGLTINGGCLDQEMHACLHNNQALAQRVCDRPGMEDATFIGDGHPGVWNAMALMRPPHFDAEAARAGGVTLEILDWYHLVENVYKTRWSKARKERICALLWEGKVYDALVNEVRSAKCNLWKYLYGQRHRIVNYRARQEAGLIIGSGAVESAVKQINARMQLPGAWWNPENVNPMLNLRTAYLNGWLYQTH
jgi:hypothetical protein